MTHTNFNSGPLVDYFKYLFSYYLPLIDSIILVSSASSAIRTFRGGDLYY